MSDWFRNALKTLRLLPWLADVRWPLTLRAFAKLTPLYPPYTALMLLQRATQLLLLSWYKEVNRKGICSEDEPPGIPGGWPLKWRRPGCLDVQLAMTTSYLARKASRVLDEHIRRIKEEIGEEIFKELKMEERPPISIIKRNLRLLVEVLRYPPKLSKMSTLSKGAFLMIKKAEDLLREGRVGEGRGQEEELSPYYDKLFEFYTAFLIAKAIEEKPLMYLRSGGPIFERGGIKVYWQKEFKTSCPIEIRPDVFVESKRGRIVFECKLWRDEKDALREALYQASFYKLSLGTEAVAVVVSSEQKADECNHLKLLKLKFEGDPFEDIKRHVEDVKKLLKSIGIVNP